MDEYKLTLWRHHALMYFSSWLGEKDGEHKKERVGGCKWDFYCETSNYWIKWSFFLSLMNAARWIHYSNILTWCLTSIWIIAAAPPACVEFLFIFPPYFTSYIPPSVLWSINKPLHFSHTTYSFIPNHPPSFFFSIFFYPPDPSIKFITLLEPPELPPSRRLL